MNEPRGVDERQLTKIAGKSGGEDATITGPASGAGRLADYGTCGKLRAYTWERVPANRLTVLAGRRSPWSL